MSADSTTKPQRIQKWILLVVSLVALAVWIRNLALIFPRETDKVAPSDLSGGNAPSAPPPLLVAASFHDSGGWHDPFAPPLPVIQPREQVDSPARKVSQSRPPLPEPPPWKLAGVVWDDKFPTAILTSPNGAQRVVVAKGDTVGAAQVERIDHGCVWIRHRGRSWKLTLETTGIAPAH